MAKTNPFYLMKNIHDKFEARGNNECQKVGLTLSQFRVLMYLIEHPNKDVTQRELELSFRVSHPTITGILKRMEEKDLISTKIIKDGKQQKLVYMTEHGKEVLSKTHESRDKDDEKLQELFTEEEINNLQDYLLRILSFLED